MIDPITLMLAAAAVAGSSGAATWFIHRRKDRARAQMMQAVQTAVPIGRDQPVSLHDLFWALGSTELALEVLGHRDLLLDSPEQLPQLLHELPAQVEEAGTYQELVSDILAAVAQYEQRASRLNRTRALPGLVAAPQRAVTGTTSMLPTGEWTQLPDADAKLKSSMGSLIEGLFEGKLAHEWKRWSAQRDAKKLRDALNRALGSLYHQYAAHIANDPSTLANLTDLARRWEAEANRIDALLQSTAFASRTWEDCARALLRASLARARQTATRASLNVEQTLERISTLADQGDIASAGYLVYVNRFALFVGRMELCADQVRSIEAASSRLNIELRKLDRHGLTST